MTEDFRVRDGIWDGTIKIATVGRKRHTMIPTAERGPNGEETRVTFCNNCACAFTINDTCPDCGEKMDNGLTLL